MRILVSASCTPFSDGGARYHIAGLIDALRERRCTVETLLLPFVFRPTAQIDGLMDFAAQLDMTRPNGQHIDRVISLQFPAYGLRHPRHTVWLMHQHRAAYELFDEESADDDARAFRQRVQDFDRAALSRANVRFANSARVAERLDTYLQLDAEPLHHPPPFAERYRCEAAEPYLFYPSRLESLKRQDLLIEAMAQVSAPVHLLLAGDGGQATRFRERVAQLGLEDRVHFLGKISEAEKIAFYARSLAVCFPTFDEDYGYITLEAMLSGKPVLTCTDSGGPLSFVVDGETGFVTEPNAAALGAAIEQLAASPSRAREMGAAGLARYHTLGISWDNTVDRLLNVGGCELPNAAPAPAPGAPGPADLSALDYQQRLQRQTRDTVHWDWEASLRQAYLRMLPREAHVVDVGSGPGEHARSFRDQLASPYLCLIEASPDAFAGLTEDFGQNNWVTLVHATLGARQEVGSSEAQTLDQILAAHPPGHLDFIRIATAGAALDVLAGGERSIFRYRPFMAVRLARGAHHAEDDPAALLTLATRWNYILCDLLGHAVRDRQEWLTLLDTDCAYYLMVPSERLGEVQRSLRHLPGLVAEPDYNAHRGFAGRAVSEIDPRELPGHLQILSNAAPQPDALRVAAAETDGAHLVSNPGELAFLPGAHFGRLDSGDTLTRVPARRIHGTLWEWNRLLRTGGQLHLVAPDIAGLGEQLQLIDSLDPDEAQALIRCLYGGDDGGRARGFPRAALTAALTDCGFGDIRFGSGKAGLLALQATKTEEVDPAPHAYLRSLTDPDQLVREAYDLLLGRPAEPAALAYYVESIADGSVARRDFIARLCASAEYHRRRILRVALA